MNHVISKIIFLLPIRFIYGHLFEANGTLPLLPVDYNDEIVKILTSDQPQVALATNRSQIFTQNLTETINSPFDSKDPLPLLTLTQIILDPSRYDPRVRPVRNVNEPLKIHVTMSLYQIIHVNEPMQNIKMNVWMIQKWTDELLDWNPNNYSLINSTILPHNAVWLPDTYVYNSVVMNNAEMERYMNIRADSLYWEGRRGARMSFLYPAIYTINCKFNIKYFPYDQQNCTITMSSWTSDSSSLDYYADDEVNLKSYIPNEEWSVISFKIYRHEYLYACCPKPWVILEASLVLRRKPLYYVLNLIIPTSIITFVAILGFFTPASTGDDRTEKFNLGITTLLAMSILLLMVSDQMPTTSEFVPLIAWYYLIIIMIIALGTLITSILMHIQNKHKFGRFPSKKVRHLFLGRIAYMLRVPIPSQLQQLWDELKDDPLKIGTAFEMTKLIKEEQEDEELENASSKTVSSNFVLTSKQKRQCCMEWAFLAAIFDRICLIVFISVVVIVTCGMIFTGLIVQHFY